MPVKLGDCKISLQSLALMKDLQVEIGICLFIQCDKEFQISGWPMRCSPSKKLVVESSYPANQQIRRNSYQLKLGGPQMKVNTKSAE